MSKNRKIRLLEKDEIALLRELNFDLDIDEKLREIWSSKAYEKETRTGAIGIILLIVTAILFLPYFFQGIWVNNLIFAVSISSILLSYILTPLAIIGTFTEKTRKEALNKSRVSNAYKKLGIGRKIIGHLLTVASISIGINLIIHGLVITGLSYLIAYVVLRGCARYSLNQTKEAVELIKETKNEELMQYLDEEQTNDDAPEDHIKRMFIEAAKKTK